MKKIMQKKVFVLFFSLFCLEIFADSWLYWCVEESGSPYEIEYNTLLIGVMNEQTGEHIAYLKPYLDNEGAASESGGEYYYFRADDYLSEGKKSLSYWSDISGYTQQGYSFYAEMRSYYNDGEVVYWGTTPGVSYNELLNGRHIDDSSEIGQPSWQPYVYTNIPEPSSAILLLTGVAALVLKRRKA